MDWTLVGFTVVSAIVYGIIFYVKAYIQAPEPKPPFDTFKFAATLVVAAIIGLITAASGGTLNEAMLLEELALYAGYVALVETILKALVGLIGKKWPTSFPEP